MSSEPPSKSNGGTDGESNKPVIPQRLQSLNSQGRGGRGGRFVPNAVNRRSKEDRESTAPAIKPVDASSSRPNDKSKDLGRGKLERRKIRQMGTRAEAAGPLAAPSLGSSSIPTLSRSMPMRTTDSDTYKSSKSSHGQHPQPTSSAKIKSETEPTQLSADVRIDMTGGGNGESYFPLRMPRETANHADGAGVSPEGSAASESLTDSKIENISEEVNLVEGSLYLIQLPELGLTVGNCLLSALNSKIPSVCPAVSPSSKPSGDASGSRTQVESQTQLNEGVQVKEEHVDVEMPDVIPYLNVEVKEEDISLVNEAAESAPHPTTMVENNVNTPLPGSCGRLGTLRKHASGKMTLLIKDQVFEVMPGTESGSPEELILLNEPAKTASLLGSINQRLLVVPDLDSLHI